MIKLSNLDVKTLTMKQGMFNKKVRKEDELELKIKNNNGNSGINNINFSIDESSIKEGIFKVQENRIFFKLQPTQLHMPCVDGATGSYVFWTNTTTFCFYDNHLYIKLNKKNGEYLLPFLLTNVYSGTTMFDHEVYHQVCHGGAWDGESLKFRDILQNAKKLLLLFLNAKPNTDLPFREQYSYLRCSEATIHNKYKKLTSLHSNIKTPEEAAQWYNMHGDNWL